MLNRLSLADYHNSFFILCDFMSANLPTITWSHRHIRSAITDDMAKLVASSLVCSRLDYVNSLLNVLHKKYLSAPARPKHTLARVVAGHTLRQDTHSSGILKHLHCLPVEKRIGYTSSLPRLPITLSAPLSLLTFITAARPVYAGTEGCSVLCFIVSFFI